MTNKVHHNAGHSWGNKDTHRAIEARKRKVVMITLYGSEVFDSIKEASIRTGFYQSAICNCCRRKQGQTGGVTFRYLENYNK